MDLQQILANLTAQLGSGLLQFLGGLAILFVGWIVALLVAGVIRAGLRRTSVDERIAKAITGEEGKLDLEKWIARIVFWVIFLFFVVAFFQTIQLDMVAGPLQGLLDQVTAFIPSLISAAILGAIAWALATGVRMLVKGAAARTNLDERLSQNVDLEETSQVTIGETLATAAYWLILLFFLPGILSTLQLNGLVAPVQDLVNSLLQALPNILGAGIIFVLGWYLARILRTIVSNLLAVTGADKLGERVGLTGEQTISKIVGTVVYALILIATLTAALGQLQIEAISGPATEMLNAVLNAIPAIFGAALLLALAYFVARLVSNLVASILSSVGFDELPGKIGFPMGQSGRKASELVAWVILIAVMLFAATEAANMLGFSLLAAMIANFTTFGGQVLLALIILAFGVYFGNLAKTFMLGAGGANSAFTANLARVAIVVFAGAMALRQMGIADEIVNLAFGIMLGAIGVAAALAFGLGSREIAGREVEKWLESMNSTEVDSE